MFGIFDTVKDDVFGDDLTRVTEKFGGKIFQLVTNIISKTIETNLELLDPLFSNNLIILKIK